MESSGRGRLGEPPGGLVDNSNKVQGGVECVVTWLFSNHANPQKLHLCDSDDGGQVLSLLAHPLLIMTTAIMGHSNEYITGCRVRLRYRSPPFERDSSADVGAKPTLPNQPNNHSPRDPYTFEIVHSYQPFTMAVVCRVRPGIINDPDQSDTNDLALPAECILKLYDRRHVSNIRKDYDQGQSYSEEKELAYQRYLRGAEKPSHEFESDSFWSEPLEDDGVFEAYIAHHCERMWEKEVATYGRMRDLQGLLVPRLLGVVTYDLPVSGNRSEVEVIQGVLLEYIPGVTLRDYITCAFESGPVPVDSDDIASVCRDAVAVVNAIGERGILNEDVRLDNILVRNQSKYHVPTRAIRHRAIRHRLCSVSR